MNEYEIEQHKQQLLEQRKKEQKQNTDFSYLENGSIEKCENCGSFINSHDHCPLCDY